jgi:hypothetical protein
VLNAVVGRGTKTFLGPYAAFTAGLLGGALVSAVALWVLGRVFAWVPDLAGILAVLAFGAACLLRDRGTVCFWLPENARQIPRSVFIGSAAKGLAQFGFELGTGARTYVTASTPYAVAFALVVLVESLTTAIAVGIGFALGRLLMPVTRAAYGDGDRWDELTNRHRIALGSASSAGAVAAIVWIAAAGVGGPSA